MLHNQLGLINMEPGSQGKTLGSQVLESWWLQPEGTADG